jgi:hypothetical protein
MTIVDIDELVNILNKNGFNIKDDFAISFVDSNEHKAKYDETRDFHISSGRTLNVDLDRDENVLSIEVLKFT